MKRVRTTALASSLLRRARPITAAAAIRNSASASAGIAAVSTFRGLHQNAGSSSGTSKLFEDPPAPAMPPGYVPINERSASDESLKFASSASTTTPPKTSNTNSATQSSSSSRAASATTTKSPSASSSAAISTVGEGSIYRPNAHLVEGYVREDGKVLTRRGDGEGAILEFVDPLPPTKLGQLKHDIVNRDIPSTPQAMREAATKSFVAKDTITRGFGAQSREDFIANVDEVQRRKDGGVPEEQLPIYDEYGQKTFRRETGRGYRSVDGGKTLIPKDKAPALEGGNSSTDSKRAFEGDEGADSNGNNENNAASSSSPSAACNMADDAEQQAALEALRRRRKSRSSKLFNNINTIDEEDYTQVAKPFTMASQTGPQTFVRHEAPEETLSEAEKMRRFDPIQQMFHEQETAAAARKDTARQRSVWADEILNDGKGGEQKSFRGDPLSERLKEYPSSRRNPTNAEGNAGKKHILDTTEVANEAGDEKITAASASADSKTKLDIAQYRKDLEELDYYVGSSSYEERKKAFDAKYNIDEWTEAQKNQFRSQYSKEQIEQGLEGEPIDLAHGSLKLQQAAAANPMLKYHPGMVSSQMGLSNTSFKGYAFSPSLELGKLQRDVAIEAARQQSVEQKVKAKDIAERVTGFDPVQRKQVRLVLADFDHKDPHTAVHVLHSYPYSDNLSVLLMCSLFLFLYKTQDAFDADEFYQEYLGIDIRTLPTLRKPMYMFMAFMVCSCMLHPCNLMAIAITRSYRIFMRRPIGPP